MPTPRTDSDLEFPRDVATVAAIPEVGGGLVRGGRSDRDALELAGLRCRVRADGLRGALEIEADGRALCGPVRVLGPPGANQLATPRSLTIERVGAPGTIHETILVPERLPGVIVQWVGEIGGEGVDIEVALPPDAARLHVDGPRLRWAREEDDGGGVLVLAGTGTRPPWTVTDDDDASDHQFGARAVARICPAPDAPVTLLASGVGAQARLPSLPALAAVVAHRRRDTLEPDDAPGLRLTTGVADLDEGVAWARALLRGGLTASEGRLRPAPGGGDVAALVVRGALAAAEMSVARSALEATGATPDDAEALALWVAWTADGTPLLEARERLQSTLATAAAALRSRIADAAEAAGDEAWAAALRAPRAAGRGLPTVGGRGLPTVGAGGPVSAAAHPDPGPTSPWDQVRADLASLRLGGPTGDVALAADTLDRLVRSALGIEPDATYGRLALRPAFPTHWNAFEASGLALGDARLEFTWERTGALHRFRLRQTAGGAPITWILEPWLFGSGLASAKVDGEPAELDAVPVGGGVRPRIQLPAERERVVELEVSPP